MTSETIHNPVKDETSLRGILIFSVVLAALITVTALALGLAMSGYRSRERREDASRPPRFRETAGQFPRPVLQGNPAADLVRLRARDDAALTSYGWVDRQAGVAHLPIDRAMEIVAEKGLPTSNAPRPNETK